MAAARAAAGKPATRADATQYELMLAKLAEDRRRLHEIQSVERKIELKKTLLPEYDAWVEGALAGSGAQDDVLMTVMVWRIDTGDLSGALAIAAYAIKHKLSMPDQYKRTTGCLLAEEFAERAMRDLANAEPSEDDCRAIAKTLGAVAELTAEEDMPDEVRAKLVKANGYALAGFDKPAALELLQRALALHDKAGVKKDIERLEREIKNSGGAGSGDA